MLGRFFAEFLAALLDMEVRRRERRRELEEETRKRLQEEFRKNEPKS